MFTFSHQLRFYIYSERVDMRKSIDGLVGLISNHSEANPLSGDVYVFINGRGDKLKMLVWDGDGFWLLYKRLEKGTFQRPEQEVSSGLYSLRYEELIMILEGIEIQGIRRRKRYKKIK